MDLARFGLLEFTEAQTLTFRPGDRAANRIPRALRLLCTGTSVKIALRPLA
jgi:hypothetical protein